jgi:predicted peptidase
MRQQARSFVGQTRSAARLRYLLYRPHGDPPPEGWPLVLFLHGSGERGAELSSLQRHGLPRLVEEGRDFPFLILSPQCPERARWYGLLTALEDVLDEVIAAEKVDVERVHLTGLSMGGYGCWHLGARSPDRFAAVVPICGGGLPSRGFPGRVRRLRELAVWAFHGELDEIVCPEETVRLVEELRACGGRVKLTLYPGVGHDSWTATYANPELYRWLLEQRRCPPPPGATTAPRRSRRAARR